MNEENKIYFTPGQLVTLRLEVPNKPIMMVSRVERSIFRNKGQEELLRGIKCRWFTKDGILQEAIFNTKDLILIK